MLAAERQAMIVELIRENGSVQVDELARELNVSSMTIRRDLVKLENSNMIERCHGGADCKAGSGLMRKSRPATKKAKQQLQENVRNSYIREIRYSWMPERQPVRSQNGSVTSRISSL